MMPTAFENKTVLAEVEPVDEVQRDAGTELPNQQLASDSQPSPNTASDSQPSPNTSDSSQLNEVCAAM